MIKSVHGGKTKKGDCIVYVSKEPASEILGWKRGMGKTINGRLFSVRTNKMADAFLIASIVTASIEIDELTAPVTGHNTNKQTER